MKATEKQVGGEHYKKLAIQPMEYSIKNNLDPLQASVIKYVTRHKDKAGRVDIEKAMHCLELILEMQYPQTSPSPEELEKCLKDCASNARFEPVRTPFTPESYKTQSAPAGTCSGCMFFNNPVCSSPGVELTTYCAENSIIYTGQK